MLRVEGLTKRYGSVVALDDVHFEVERGQIVGFLGPNGAGKTTAMRAIMRLIALDRGTVTWDGEEVGPVMRRHFGYMPAERGMYPRMRVHDHLVYYGRLSDLDRESAAAAAEEWLERLGLAERRDDPVETLSSGNQQRVQLALALLGSPEVLVLDEPFSGLDPVAVDTLSEVLREQVDRGVALLLSSHQLDLVADVCSAVVIVDRGRVVLRGDVAALRSSSSVRQLEVEFASPTEWSPSGIEVATDDAVRYRATVRPDADGSALFADARVSGELVAFAFAPPDLSEVFLDAVGRSSAETSADLGSEGDTGNSR